MWDYENSQCGVYRIKKDNSVEMDVSNCEEKKTYYKCGKDEKCVINKDYKFIDLNQQEKYFKIIDTITFTDGWIGDEYQNEILNGSEFNFTFIKIDNILIVCFPWGGIIDVEDEKIKKSFENYLNKLIEKINELIQSTRGIIQLNLHGHSMGSFFIIYLLNFLYKINFNNIHILLSGVRWKNIPTKPKINKRENQTFEITSINIGYIHYLDEEKKFKEYIDRYDEKCINYQTSFKIFFIMLDENKNKFLRPDEAATGKIKIDTAPIEMKLFHDFKSIMTILRNQEELNFEKKKLKQILNKP